MKKMSLRNVKSTAQVCRLHRDNYEVGDWWISTDGYRVWISKQKMGQGRTDHIEVPKAIFDKLLAHYDKPKPIGKWDGDKFTIDR